MSDSFAVFCLGFAALAFGALCLVGAGWLFQVGRLMVCA